jgi:hypothetical protein
MHQRSSVWFGEYRPSIVCISSTTFSIVDIQLVDCLWFIAGNEDFDIVEFECFQGSEVPEKIPQEKIVNFNQSDPERKLHEFLKWIRVDNPTYLSLQCKSTDGWSLVYFDNQLWFEIRGGGNRGVKHICLAIFESMMLPAKLIYDFVTDLDWRNQELEVADFVAIRESIVQKELETAGNFNSRLKINTYGTKHFPIHPKTLAPDEFFISPESEEKGEGSVQILVNCVKSLKQDTLLIFISSKHDLCSPTFRNMPFAAPYFLNAKEEAIMKKMSMYDCVDDLVLVKLPPIIGVTTVVMILPEGFDDFDPPKRIDIALELVSRALDMCASCDQKRIHLMDPTVDLKLYEGVFGPKFMHLALNHTANNRAQWVFWHCRSLMSYRHYQELRKSIMAKTDEWDPEFKPKYDAYPF